jgi:hypothetical protein
MFAVCGRTWWWDAYQQDSELLLQQQPQLLHGLLHSGVCMLIITNLQQQIAAKQVICTVSKACYVAAPAITH